MRNECQIHHRVYFGDECYYCKKEREALSRKSESDEPISMKAREMANCIRIMAFQCKSKDVMSCEFGNEFGRRVEEFIEHELNATKEKQMTLIELLEDSLKRNGHAELCVSGDSRIDELRMCGNGVVPATAQRAFGVLCAKLIRAKQRGLNK